MMNKIKSTLIPDDIARKKDIPVLSQTLSIEDVKSDVDIAKLLSIAEDIATKNDIQTSGHMTLDEVNNLLVPISRQIVLLQERIQELESNVPEQPGEGNNNPTKPDDDEGNTDTPVVKENNKIYYTSLNDAVITPSNNKGFGANIISNENGVITFDGNVTTIPYACFKNNVQLKSIILPDTVTNLESYCFYGCTQLTEIDMSSNLKIIDNYAFYDCERLESVELPHMLQAIGTGAFEQCLTLKEVKMYDGVTSVGSYCYSSCYSLTNVRLSDSLTYVSRGCFSGCRSLENIHFSNNLQYIEGDAFSYCVSLKTIKLPSTLKTIYRYVFSGASLQDIVCYATQPPVVRYGQFSPSNENYSYSDSRYEITKTLTNATLKVPELSVSVYQQSLWSSVGTSSNYTSRSISAIEDDENNE